MKKPFFLNTRNACYFKYLWRNCALCLQHNVFYLYSILQITFLLRLLPLYRYSIIRVLISCITLIICVLRRKIHSIQWHGFMRNNIKFALRVHCTYGLLPLLSRPITCFWVQLRAGRQKFGTIRLIALMHIFNLRGLRRRRDEIWE